MRLYYIWWALYGVLFSFIPAFILSLYFPIGLITVGFTWAFTYFSGFWYIRKSILNSQK